MARARMLLTATLLTSGKVLVVGGFNYASGILGTAELYDPKTRKWTATGSLVSPRSNHTTTLLADGRVLVAGGTDGVDPINTVEIYNPTTGTWTATGSLLEARLSHAATLLLDGRVLVTGGYDGGALENAEIYDPASGTWSSAGSFIDARWLHTATLLPSGKVLVAGGAGTELTPLASAENAAVDAASSNADAPSFRPAPDALCSEWTMQTCSPKSEGDQINDGT